MKCCALALLLALCGGWAKEATVFVVLLDDGGRQGALVGCGDSLVPLVLELETGTLRATATGRGEAGALVALKDAPLEAARAALVEAAVNALLALEPAETTPAAGAPRVHNALAHQALRLVRLDTEGAWRLELEGRLALGGVCEVARLEAQLLATARQFSWSRALGIYLNGQPLKEALSPR